MRRHARTTWRTIDDAVKRNEAVPWQQALDEIEHVVHELWVKCALHDGVDSSVVVTDLVLAVVDPDFRAAWQTRLTGDEIRIARAAKVDFMRQKYAPV